MAKEICKKAASKVRKGLNGISRKHQNSEENV